jgi:hypothetical protein
MCVHCVNLVQIFVSSTVEAFAEVSEDRFVVHLILLTASEYLTDYSKLTRFCLHSNNLRLGVS